MDPFKRPLQVVRELYGGHQAPTCEEAHRAVVARFRELLSDPAVLQQVGSLVISCWRVLVL